MTLRPPAFVLLGPAQLAWLLIFCGLVGWAVLVLSERYVLAAVGVVIGVAAIWAGGRILHQLARRWVVFVPAGFVIHDPLMLVDSVLLRRNEVTRVGPAIDSHDLPVVDAPAGSSGEEATEAGGPFLDLSGGALGLALEVALRAPTPVTIRERGQARNTELGTIVFTPTLPGAMLSEARIRGMKIASAAGPAS